MSRMGRKQFEIMALQSLPLRELVKSQHLIEGEIAEIAETMKDLKKKGPVENESDAQCRLSRLGWAKDWRREKVRIIQEEIDSRLKSETVKFNQCFYIACREELPPEEFESLHDLAASRVGSVSDPTTGDIISAFARGAVPKPDFSLDVPWNLDGDFSQSKDDLKQLMVDVNVFKHKLQAEITGQKLLQEQGKDIDLEWFAHAGVLSKRLGVFILEISHQMGKIRDREKKENMAFHTTFNDFFVSVVKDDIGTHISQMLFDSWLTEAQKRLNISGT